MDRDLGSVFHEVTEVYETGDGVVRVRVKGAPGHLPIRSKIIPKGTRLDNGGHWVRVDLCLGDDGIMHGEVGELVEIVPSK